LYIIRASLLLQCTVDVLYLMVPSRVMAKCHAFEYQNLRLKQYACLEPYVVEGQIILNGLCSVLLHPISICQEHNSNVPIVNCNGVPVLCRYRALLDNAVSVLKFISVSETDILYCFCTQNRQHIWCSLVIT